MINGRKAWNRTDIYKNCPICDKKYKVIPSQLEKGWGQTCSMSCRNRYRPDIYAKKGKESHAYKNGISLYRDILEQKECLKCHSDKFLLVHHLDGDRTNNKIDNLQVLCKRCHQIDHGCIKTITEYNMARLKKQKK